MLKHLDVKNFALIDDLEIDFHDGLTALTGETGSGKSILLESLSLLFGKRSDAEYIRHGASKALVTGNFILNDEQQKSLDLPREITLSREIDATGRHLIKINHETSTLQRLKQIANKIGLIHGQNDTHMLMDKASYVDFVDQLDKSRTQNLLNNYLLKRSTYHELNKHYESLKSKKKETLERVDFLTYQVKELDALSLKTNELEELQEQVSKLKNFDRIQQALKETVELLNGPSFALDNLYDGFKNLQKISSFDKSYEVEAKVLEDSYYNLEDSIKNIENLFKSLDFDEESFNLKQQRIFELNKIETKYGKSINDLVIYLAQIKEELALSTDYDGYLKDQEIKLKKAYEDALKEGLVLRKYRMELAKKLEKELTESLHQLDLTKAKFEIQFETLKDNQALEENGIDSLEFMISLNEGEPLKPLAKVASGGEKARFMFSLKSIFARNSKLSMLVFDEIDIGISGKTASKVATKMKELSKDIQTLTITHLPQVAAKADHHYAIYKEKKDGRIQTFIDILDKEKRILAIASMLSDESISPFAIEQAKALLNQN
ncbi:DNA repair protein RecN [Acholeplasma hippikon]|uniref:DNA repair protein RecN n=1 Tax=Acholeplasma hippikon TaxID=264636 RepID=A0A449BI97_9MOLU|nr:DNA repair protein RecN [Acholeplasma hippikon]VEU82179.1 Recombination protein N [Acholeplasma hippikon]